MKMKHIFPLLTGLFLLAVGTRAASAANVYNIVWDGTVTESFSADTSEYSSQMRLASSVGGGMPLPNITADFSSDSEWQVNFSAVSGQRIYVNSPTFPGTTGNERRLWFSVQSSNPLQGQFFNGTTDGVSFTGLQGIAPVVGFGGFEYASSSFFGGTNPQFGAPLRFDYSESFSFTGLTMNFTAPANLTTAYNDVSAVGSIDFQADGDVLSGTPTDPGQWVTLVPEPSRALLSLLGLGVVLARRRQ